MIYPVDVLGPRVVCRVRCKVDGTLTIAVESKLLLLNSQLSDEVLHLDYFHAGFYGHHVLRLRS